MAKNNDALILEPITGETSPSFDVRMIGMVNLKEIKLPPGWSLHQRVSVAPVKEGCLLYVRCDPGLPEGIFLASQLLPSHREAVLFWVNGSNVRQTLPPMRVELAVYEARRSWAPGDAAEHRD